MKIIKKIANILVIISTIGAFIVALIQLTQSTPALYPGETHGSSSGERRYEHPSFNKK